MASITVLEGIAQTAQLNLTPNAALPGSPTCGLGFLIDDGDNLVGGAGSPVTLPSNANKNVILGANCATTLGSGDDNNIFIGEHCANQVSSSSGSCDNAVMIGQGTYPIGHGGSRCIFIGQGIATTITNNAGSDAVVIGHNSGHSANPYRMVLIGAYSGSNMSGGSDCPIAIGFNAAQACGSNSYGGIVIGGYAAKDATSIHSSVIIGYRAAQNLTSDGNVFIGLDTAHDATSSAHNVYVGRNTGYHITSNDNNTFIGHYAGGRTEHWNRCTFLGSGAGESSSPTATITNAIGLGFDAVPLSSYQCSIGNFEITKLMLGGDTDTANTGLRAAFRIATTDGSTDDKPGRGIIIATGRPTGNSGIPSISFETSTGPTASGSTLQTLSTKFTIKETPIISATALPSSPSIGQIAIDSGGSNALKFYDGSVWITTWVYAENTDVDTGTEVVDTFADTDMASCMWQYEIKNSAGTALQSGLISACWDASTDTVSSPMILSSGNVGTVDISLSVDISSNNVRLLATATSDNWIVKVKRSPMS